MATLMVRQSTVNGLPGWQKQLLTWLAVYVELGKPALYQTGGAVTYLTYDDPRISFTDLALIGCVTGKLAEINGWQPALNPDGSINRPLLVQQATNYVAGNLILPPAIAPKPNEDYEITVLAANGAPVVVRAGPTFFATLVPKP